MRVRSTRSKKERIGIRKWTIAVIRKMIEEKDGKGE
jgi:hypothetical protein